MAKKLTKDDMIGAYDNDDLPGLEKTLTFYDDNVWADFVKERLKETGPPPKEK